MTRLWAIVLGTAALSVLASLRPIVLYLPPSLGVAAAIGMVAAGALGCTLLARGYARPWWILLAASVITVVVAGAIYPIVDARSEVGLGSDQDDAVRDMAMGILSGRYPFATPTYAGNPPSPGPLWVVLHVPFVTAGAYILAPVAAMALCAWMLTRAAGLVAAAGAGVLLMTSPAFWEALAIGSDQITVGCLSVVLLVLVSWSRTMPHAIGVAWLSAALGTSRAVFPFIPAVAGLVARDSRRGSLAALCGAAISVVIHAAFLQWGPGGYGPMHVVGEAQIMLQGWQAWASGAVTVGALAVTVAIKPVRMSSQMAGLGVVLAIPLTIMMLVRSADDFSDVAHWGANYVIAALVVLAAGAGLAVAEVARGPSGKMV